MPGVFEGVGGVVAGELRGGETAVGGALLDDGVGVVAGLLDEFEGCRGERVVTGSWRWLGLFWVGVVEVWTRRAGVGGMVTVLARRLRRRRSSRTGDWTPRYLGVAVTG